MPSACSHSQWWSPPAGTSTKYASSGCRDASAMVTTMRKMVMKRAALIDTWAAGERAHDCGACPTRARTWIAICSRRSRQEQVTTITPKRSAKNRYGSPVTGKKVAKELAKTVV